MCQILRIMGDYESRLYDVQLDFSSLCDRINRRDASLCDEDWCGITNNFDLGWIEAVYKNIKVDDMFDVVTELICRQYSTMVAKGLIDDSIPHINEAGMVIDYPEYYLNKFRDDIRSQRTAEELERKTRHELKQKMMQIKKDEEVRTLQTSIHFDANDVHDVEERNNNVDFTEDLANSIDWVKLTHNFDLDRIKDIVNTIGKTPRDKKIIVKAIYNAETSTGEMYKIPYTVDRLLYDLYKEYDENHKGLWDAAYNENTETLNIDVLMKQAIEEYMARHTATDADIDEIFADTPTNKGIDLNECSDQIDISTLPEEFQSPEAEHIMQKLIKAGLLDINWQPVNLSIAERGYLADEISSRLKIKSKWKVLGALWNENSETLRQGKNKAVEQTKTGIFIKKLKIILG